jgi:RNA polymerase-binding transcription factor DksA
MNGGTDMDAKVEKLYSELRNTRQELLEKLMDDHSSKLIRPFILDELYDVESTLERIEKGVYGKCEVSGELLPDDILAEVPTMKTMDDCNRLENYYRKSLYE